LHDINSRHFLRQQQEKTEHRVPDGKKLLYELVWKEVVLLARNRCSYEKRAKEIARKQKQEEKTKRRQNKSQAKSSEDTLDMDLEGEAFETEAQQAEEEYSKSEE